MPRVLLLPGLHDYSRSKKLGELTRAGFDVNPVVFDDTPIADLCAVSKAPLRHLNRAVTMLIKSRRIYAKWVSEAQAAFDDFRPDIVVASSRGGSVAMTMKIDDQIPILLLAPAYKWFRWVGGRSSINRSNVTIIHSRQDQQIPFSDSEDLCRRCPHLTLLAAGVDHSLVTPDASAVWLKEIHRLLGRD